MRVIERQATGLYLLTNNEPVPILEFLGSIFEQLGLPACRRRLPAGQAMRLAGAVECLYALMPFLGEPPITRFGVSVFAYSKTFNVAKSLRDLGSPSVALDEGVARFVQWQKGQTAWKADPRAWLPSIVPLPYAPTFQDHRFRPQTAAPRHQFGRDRRPPEPQSRMDGPSHQRAHPLPVRLARRSPMNSPGRSAWPRWPMPTNSWGRST